MEKTQVRDIPGHVPASLSVSKRKNFLEEWLSKGLERLKEYGRIEGREGDS